MARRPDRVELEYEESSPRAEASRRRRERLFQVLEAAAVFYERYLWEAPRADAARAYLPERGLGEDVCREFRLGLSPDGDDARQGPRAGLQLGGARRRRARQPARQRLLRRAPPLRASRPAGPRRRIRRAPHVGDDPIQAKYVNSPEGELFHKASLVYGLDVARAAIAKEDRAVVVEGYTDVLALRQADLETAVASMGTALTPAQLKELRRLTGRLYLCFDSDAAGEAATLRGMDLAVAEGFDVRVVPLPPGVDPAETAATFDDYFDKARSYAVHRVQVELSRGGDPTAVYERVKLFLDGLPESPDRHDAWQVANDALDLTVQIRAAASSTRAAAQAVSRRVLEAGDRLERDALAGVVAYPALAAGPRRGLARRTSTTSSTERSVAPRRARGSEPGDDGLARGARRPRGRGGDRRGDGSPAPPPAPRTAASPRARARRAGAASRSSRSSSSR